MISKVGADFKAVGELKVVALAFNPVWSFTPKVSACSQPFLDYEYLSRLSTKLSQMIFITFYLQKVQPLQRLIVDKMCTPNKTVGGSCGIEISQKW